jgi:hypothetical protein
VKPLKYVENFAIDKSILLGKGNFGKVYIAWEINEETKEK